MEELRSLAAETMHKTVLTHAETLELLRSQATAIAEKEGVMGDVSVKKRLAKINMLMNEGVKAIQMMEDRIVAAEDGYRLLCFTLLTDLKREQINVPAKDSEKKRVALIPSDLGDVTKRRRTAAAAAEGAKKRKKKRARKKRHVSTASAKRKGPSKTAAKKNIAAGGDDDEEDDKDKNLPVKIKTEPGTTTKRKGSISHAFTDAKREAKKSKPTSIVRIKLEDENGDDDD